MITLLGSKNNFFLKKTSCFKEARNLTWRTGDVKSRETRTVQIYLNRFKEHYLKNI